MIDRVILYLTFSSLVQRIRDDIEGMGRGSSTNYVQTTYSFIRCLLLLLRNSTIQWTGSRVSINHLLGVVLSKRYTSRTSGPSSLNGLRLSFSRSFVSGGSRKVPDDLLQPWPTDSSRSPDRRQPESTPSGRWRSLSQLFWTEEIFGGIYFPGDL